MPVEYVVKFCQYIEGKFDHGNEMFKPCTVEDECCTKEVGIDVPKDDTEEHEGKKCCKKGGKECCKKAGYKCCGDKECCAKEGCKE